MKYYMTERGECAYPLEYFIDSYDDGEILFEMKRDIGGEMWCAEYRIFVGGECGNNCEYYDPCNGISGRCRSLIHGFVETGRKYILKNSKIEIKKG